MKKITLALLLVFLVFSCCACSSGPQYEYGSPEVEDHESEYLEDEDLYFGRGEVIAPTENSEVLIEYASPLDCTLESLAAWFEQDVKGSGYSYALIIYDGGDSRGVYASPDGVIHTDVVIEGDAFVDTTEKSRTYIYKNGKLEE